MAPAQSRFLIWSLPTLVLLFGFFWYKRKKSFFQTDPGGKDNTSIKPSSNCNKVVTNTRDNYDDEDDDEYTVHDLQFSSSGSVSQVGNNYLQSKEDWSSDSPLFESCLSSSTPFDEKKNKEVVEDNIKDLTSSKNCQTLANNITVFDFLDLKLDKIEPTLKNITEASDIVEENSTMVRKRKQISSESSIAESNSSNCPYEESTDVQENKENENFNGTTKEAEGFNKTFLVLPKNEELPSVNSQCNNTSCLENKLSNLGLNTAQSIEKSERDSANHSPAEVMLGSPSMCHFSDEHSEGSSDSGKGCSDVVTPPSRTPAGGSSVAGDQILSIYEFVLEQHIVGRLIGRHGSYLQDIRAKTNTNLFIKRHPETNKLKICAIEGSQQDIEAALAMIRQKFPLRRFPNLTLEKVTFVQPSSHCPLKPEIFQLQLVNGVNNDVLLSSLITAGHFFLQQPTHPSYPDLQKLNVMMNALYSSPEAPPLSEPIVDAICVAPTMGGWYRAQIMSIDEQNATSDVRFLDYGGYLTINNSLLRQIRGDFLLLPFQAIECILANVVPAGGEGAEWSEEARQVVQYHTQQQILQAQVYQYTETGIPLVYLYSTQATQNGLEVVLINQQLVARGYAEMVVASTDDDVQ